MSFNYFVKISTFFFISFFLLSCSNQDKNLELATFGNDHVYQSEYVDHYLLSSKYKPKKLPTVENLKEIVLMKALEKMSFQEAKSLDIEKDSLYTRIIKNNERRLLFQKYVQNEITESIISDSLIQKFYSEFSPQYRMKYIMRPFIRTSTQKFIDSQKDQIEEAYKLLKNGKKFKEVTKKYSQDISSNKKGGDIGWIIRESMGDKALRVVMDTLSQHTYSKPFKGYGGYYIMFKGEKRDVKVPEFESVKQKIYKTLYHSRKVFIEVAIEKRFNELIKKYNYLPFHDKIQRILKNINNEVNVDENIQINFDKLSDKDKSTIIAEYNGGYVIIDDLFADRKRSPTTKAEFLTRFKSISQMHLFAKHAKELGIQNEPELKSQLDKMKSSLLSTILYQRSVKDKLAEYFDSNDELSTEEKVKKKNEYEKTLRTEFENKLKSKYKFKFEENNFDKVLKFVSEKKKIQNSEKVTK